MKTECAKEYLAYNPNAVCYPVLYDISHSARGDYKLLQDENKSKFCNKYF